MARRITNTLRVNRVNILEPEEVEPIDTNDGFIDDILSEVQVEFFTASPDAIVPFGKTSVSWQVNGPRDEWGVPKFTLKLTKIVGSKRFAKPVALSGTINTELIKDTRFRLDAVIANKGKYLGQVPINVDDSACEQKTIVLGTVMAVKVKEKVDELLSRFDFFRPFPNPTANPNNTVPQPPPKELSTSFQSGMLEVYIPLMMKIPYWFDASFEAFFKFNIYAENTNIQREISDPEDSIVIQISEFNIDVSWNNFEHFLSVMLPGGPNTIALQNAIQEILEGLISGFLGDIIESEIANILQGLINVVRLNLERRSNHTYRLMDIVISTEANSLGGYLEAVFCPTPQESTSNFNAKGVPQKVNN